MLGLGTPELLLLGLMLLILLVGIVGGTIVLVLFAVRRSR